MERTCLLLLLCACSTPEGPSNDTDLGGDSDSAHDSDVAPEPVRFAFPLADASQVDDLIGVDHDPETHGDSVAGGAICTDYQGRGFPHCYDGHDGSDFILEGGFPAMDAGSLAVIAAAPGTVIDVRDGNYDRCHATFGGSVDFDGHPQVANAVILEHADGNRSMYWHLKRDSVSVSLGEVVPRGHVLGLVGSSGTSSLPHLHFEVQRPNGEVVDPFAGPESQEESWWCTQEGNGYLPGDCAE